MSVNLVFYINGGTPSGGVWEQGAEENILTKEGWSDGRVEWNLRDLYISPLIIRAYSTTGGEEEPEEVIGSNARGK
jgi:hypothetical protein